MYVMAMEVGIIPTKVVLAFDSMSKLSESAHAQGYEEAFRITLLCIKNLFSESAKLMLPDNAMLSASERKIGIGKEFTLDEAIQSARLIANALYFLEDYEVNLEITDSTDKCQLKCYSDPIVFTLINLNDQKKNGDQEKADSKRRAQ
jgi:hypothetical protein